MISVENLKKSYGDNPALKGISFEIGKGEFYGLLGPNGAGKTTTINIISTLVNPDEGRVAINGNDLTTHPRECKSAIGVVPQEIALYNELSAYDNLMFWGGLYNVPKNVLSKRIDTTLELFGLLDRKKDKVKTYSGGMKRRINIASALLHDPQILFMDEPTVGIDPQSRNLIYEVMRKLHSEGMTFVYTTHYMEEAERFCDRIGIIDNGEIITQGSLHELRTKSGLKECISIKAISISPEQEKEIGNYKTGGIVTGNAIKYFSDDVRNDLAALVGKCRDSGIDIENIDIEKINLESIFLHHTGKKLRD